MFTSILRTVVPYLWGSFVGWLLSLVPILEPLRADLLEYGDAAVPIVGAVLAGAWYALWRWLEPRLPAWLTRAFLGSAQRPIYDGQSAKSAKSASAPTSPVAVAARHGGVDPVNFPDESAPKHRARE